MPPVLEMQSLNWTTREVLKLLFHFHSSLVLGEKMDEEERFPRRQGHGLAGAGLRGCSGSAALRDEAVP